MLFECVSSHDYVLYKDWRDRGDIDSSFFALLVKIFLLFPLIIFLVAAFCHLFNSSFVHCLLAFYRDALYSGSLGEHGCVYSRGDSPS